VGSRVLGVPGSTVPCGSRGHWRLFSAINSAARRGTCAADGRTIERIGWPTGTSGTPTSASSSAKSGGAHTRTFAPSARNRTASPTSGSTSPRDPCVDNNTRISRLAFP